MPQLTIDSVTCTAAPGATVLDAARDAGIDIPSLCADPRLAPAGACRMCLVDIDGEAHPVASCATPALDGMVVHAHTDELERVRRETLDLLERARPATPDPALVDDSHPLIQVDLNACIDCWRCVRICDEVQGQRVWHVRGRGSSSRLVAGDGEFGDSDCVSCGACVDTCPTDALRDRSPLTPDQHEPDRWTRTICPYCAVGCELVVGAAGQRIVATAPSLDSPVNRGHACVKGRYAHDFVHAADRVTEPMVRDPDGTWREVTWEVGIAAAADRLRHALSTTGPGSVAVLTSARATNEENYLYQKLARVALRTNNVDCCARVCHAPSAAGLKRVLGTGAATSSFDDIELARTIVVCGSNTTENHPVVGARIRQAARRGAELIVIDPRRIELVDDATLHLAPHPGATIPLLLAMAHVIVAEGLADDTFLAGRVTGLEEFADSVRDWTPERAEAACGVPAADTRAAARRYATATPSIIFWGLGMTEHTQGVDGVVALANLALLTGNLGRPGAGVNPLRGQNNVQGAAHMGCEPNHLPGYAPLADHRARVEAVWGAPIPHERGLDAMECLDAATDGGVRAMVVAGWDLAATQPDANTTERALASLDALVVVDLFLNETARRHAHVFLPAASPFEKDGTYMSSERRVQRIRPVVDAPDAVRTDSQIVGMLAAELGVADRFPATDAATVWDEIRAVWPPGAGMTWGSLGEPGGRQWPCPTEGHGGTIRLHTEVFGHGERTTALHPTSYRPSVEQTDDQHPLVLVTGRSLTQFNAGTMTRRSASHVLRPTDRLEVSPADAASLGVTDGDPVRVESRYGAATLPAEVTDRVAAGTVFATFQDPAVDLNRVTGPLRDPVTHTPEYKRTAVRVTAVEPTGGLRPSR